MAKFPHGLHMIMHIGMASFLSLVIKVWLICPSKNTPRHPSINEGSLFCLSHWDLPNHNGPPQSSWYSWNAFHEKGALTRLWNVQPYNARIIEYWTILSKENETQSKLISLEKLGQPLGNLESTSIGGISRRWFCNFRPKVGEILNFGLFSSLEINLNFKIVLFIIGLYCQGPVHIWSRYIVAFTLGPVARVTVEFMV